MKKKLEEKNNEESEDDLELKKIEEDLGINNIEKDQKEKKSIKDDKNNEEIAYKNTNFIESLKGQASDIDSILGEFLVRLHCI